MNDRAHPRAAQVFELVVLSVAGLALTLNRGFYEQLTNNVFFSLTLAACAAASDCVRAGDRFLRQIRFGRQWSGCLRNSTTASIGR
jgi:hypothetical protein